LPIWRSPGGHAYRLYTRRPRRQAVNAISITTISRPLRRRIYAGRTPAKTSHRTDVRLYERTGRFAQAHWRSPGVGSREAFAPLVSGVGKLSTRFFRCFRLPARQIFTGLERDDGGHRLRAVSSPTPRAQWAERADSRVTRASIRRRLSAGF
jgi:hypothetical protein